jgi:uncharacterized protein (TIRG00374 family)
MLTVASLAVLFYATSTGETLTALSHIEIHFLFLAAFLQLIDIGLGAWRNHILVRKLKPGIKWWLCFKAQLANEFGAAVTPGQSGGGPAWLYVLNRGGISLGSGVAVSVVVFLSTLIFFQISTMLSVFAVGDRFSGQSLFYLLQFGFITSTGMLVVILLTLCMPGRICSLMIALNGRLRHSQKRWKARLARITERIAEGIKQYQSDCVQFLRQHRISVFKTFLITSLYYLIKLHLAYVILLGLGVSINYLLAIPVLALLRFILYFTPTPGGSGIGEISIAALMAALIPTYLLPVYTILYRFFYLFLPAAFGAWVLLSELKGAAESRSY